MKDDKQKLEEYVKKTEDLMDKLEEHSVILAKVEKQLEKELSRSHQLKMAGLRFITTALGATIGIAVVIILIKRLVETTDIFPILNDILKIILANLPQT